MVKDKILTLIFPDGKVSKAQEKLIDTIFDIQKRRLMSYLPEEMKEVPEALEHIVIETVITRYNRIGSEGMSKETVEGHSMEFSSGDISSYQDEIQAFLEGLEDAEPPEKLVRFI